MVAKIQLFWGIVCMIMSYVFLKFSWLGISTLFLLGSILLIALWWHNREPSTKAEQDYIPNGYDIPRSEEYPDTNPNLYDTMGDRIPEKVEFLNASHRMTDEEIRKFMSSQTKRTVGERELDE